MQSQNELTWFVFYTLIKNQSLEEIKDIYENSSICKTPKVDPAFRFIEIIRKVSFENELAKFAKKAAFLIANKQSQCPVLQKFKENAEAYLAQVQGFKFIGNTPIACKVVCVKKIEKKM
jgi:hypothetical protein